MSTILIFLLYFAAAYRSALYFTALVYLNS